MSEVSFKAHLELEQVASYLEDLASSLRQGKVYVQQGNQVTELLPTSDVELELEAGGKKQKQKLSIELSWRKQLETMTREGAGLSIGSQKPEVAEPEEPAIEQPLAE